jgi:large subunit ribosomal protein L33
MAKKLNREVVTLACGECKERNYTTQKNKKNDPGRLEFDKYCPHCRVVRTHRETK